MRVDLTVHHPTNRLYHIIRLASIHIIRPTDYTTSFDWHQSTSSDHSVIRPFRHSIAINPHHPTIRLYDHSVIDWHQSTSSHQSVIRPFRHSIGINPRHPTNRLYDHSVNQLASIHIIRPFDYTTIPSIDWHQSTSSDQSVIPHHSIAINPHHSTNRLYDHSVIQLASIHIIRPFDYTTIPSFNCHHPTIPSFDCHRLPRVYTLGWVMSHLRRLLVDFP